IVDSPTAAAPGATVTTAFSGACSSVRRTVISFVMLAIGTCAVGLNAARTSPVVPLSTMNAFAWTRGSPASAGEAARTTAAAATTRRRTPRTLAGRLPHAHALADVEG